MLFETAEIDARYIFGCGYCAGVGYEDYPSNKIPCRIPGHRELHEKHVQEIYDYFELNPLPQPDDMKCPYCGKFKCSHWAGRGWNNPKFKKES